LIPARIPPKKITAVAARAQRQVASQSLYTWATLGRGGSAAIDSDPATKEQFHVAAPRWAPLTFRLRKI
jgi:hypothetical protein